MAAMVPGRKPEPGRIQQAGCGGRLQARAAITGAHSPREASGRLRLCAFGSMGYENAVNEKGERLIWLEPNVVDRLRAMRGPGESWSDVILWLAGEG
jgi:hypothetical protein